MNCIAAVDNKFGIGKNNELLFRIPADMEFFKKKTVGKVVIMGKNTLMSFPNGNPLPNRTNIVISSSLMRNDCIVCRSLPKLFEFLREFETEDVFVIGGAAVYRQLLPYCSKAYITKINADKNADKFFPDIDSDINWELYYKGNKQLYNNIDFRFCEYVNKKLPVGEEIQNGKG